MNGIEVSYNILKAPEALLVFWQFLNVIKICNNLWQPLVLLFYWSFNYHMYVFFNFFAETKNTIRSINRLADHWSILNNWHLPFKRKRKSYILSFIEQNCTGLAILH